MTAITPTTIRNAMPGDPKLTSPGQLRITAKEYREGGWAPKLVEKAKRVPGPSAQDLVATIAKTWPATDRLSIDLPTPPSLNNAYVNAVGHGRTKSPNARKFYAEATALLATLGQRFEADGYRAHIVVTREHPRADIDGRAKLVLDVLVKTGIIPDDRHCEKLQIEWRYKHPPGCTVMLSRYRKRRVAA